MIDNILTSVSRVKQVEHSTIGRWRREEEFTDVTLVEEGGTLERKGEGEYLGKEVFIKLVGDKSCRDKGVSTKEIQEFRRSGIRTLGAKSVDKAGAGAGVGAGAGAGEEQEKKQEQQQEQEQEQEEEEK